MGHTRPSHLQDLTDELDAIRALAGVREKSLGIFYLKATPFLHFHDKDGARWADVKDYGEWVRFDVPFGAKAAARTRFLRAVKAAHARLVKD